MPGKVYLIQPDGSLEDMSEQSYANENLLQLYLERYPDLLPGEQINEASPRRWLLIGREIGIPNEVGGGGHWALDHLFLDQDAIPTLVEVKLVRDSRIRREVVGQMLDYAANAVLYWPVETLRVQFESACTIKGNDPNEILRQFLAPADPERADIEAFWLQVKTNLQAGRIRMIFVADHIPQELRRIVEFMNQQMDPTEVLAVELRQYVGQQIRTIVPRVLGQTAEAQQKKSTTRQTRGWETDSFLVTLEERYGPEQASVAKKLMEWASTRSLDSDFGKGTQTGSFIAVFTANGVSRSLFYILTSGHVQIGFQYIRQLQPFDKLEMRQELRNQLNEITGVSISEYSLEKFPSIPLKVLSNEASYKRFEQVLDWMLQKLRQE